MKLKLLLASLGLAFSLSVYPAAAETYVASWNVLHLGWNNGKSVEHLAKVGSSFDLIALQEVMDEDGLADFETALEAQTGEDWSTMASHAVGSSRYKELYAFVWRPSRVEWVDGATVYIDDRDAFLREPFSARFRTADDFTFVLSTAHLIYGDRVEQRESEAGALARYKQWLKQSFPDTPVIIAGDFNLPPDNSGWGPLAQTSYPLIQEGGTTLSKTDDKFASLYDNFWVPASMPLPISNWGILDMPEIVGLTHAQAREQVSDHVPVWMTIDVDGQWHEFDPWSRHLKADDQSLIDQKANDASTDVVRANRSSQIYHTRRCPGYVKISDRNIVVFASAGEAEAAGYRMARNCD